MTKDNDIEDWLKNVNDGNPDVVDYSFPSDSLKKEYIATIEERLTPTLSRCSENS